jgi:hypothetical protein
LIRTDTADSVGYCLLDGDRKHEEKTQLPVIVKQKSSPREPVFIVKQKSSLRSRERFDLSSSSSSDEGEGESAKESPAVNIREVARQKSYKGGDAVFVQRYGSKDESEGVRSTHAVVAADHCEIDAVQGSEEVAERRGVEPPFPKSTVLNVRKKFLMGDAGKALSMEFREQDARNRLDERLQRMREKKQSNGQQDVSHETKRRSSDQLRELTKRVTAHDARHRLSISYARDDAKQKLNERLKKIAKKHEEREASKESKDDDEEDT